MCNTFGTVGRVVAIKQQPRVYDLRDTRPIQQQTTKKKKITPILTLHVIFGFYGFFLFLLELQILSGEKKVPIYYSSRTQRAKIVIFFSPKCLVFFFPLTHHIFYFLLSSSTV